MPPLEKGALEEFGGARYWNTAPTKRKRTNSTKGCQEVNAETASITKSPIVGAKSKAAIPKNPAAPASDNPSVLRTTLPSTTRERSPKDSNKTNVRRITLSAIHEYFITPDIAIPLARLGRATPKPLLLSPFREYNLLKEYTPAEKINSAGSNNLNMAPSSKDNPAKRKATEEPNTPSDNKRIKSSHSDSEEPEVKVKKGPNPIPFPEKPAVIEERNGEIEFRVVNNDNQRESLVILTGLKCIFQKQLPKMPKDYIARLVYDRTHLSMAIVKKPLEVVGGITYRPFKGRKFAEIVFCAISSDQQVKGYGAHLMSHLKDYVKATSDVMHFLTYADNYAIGYFKKQGFTKEITLEKPVWMGYIKDYEGGTIMQCSMLPRVRYLEQGRMLLKQKEAVHAKIRAFSQSHVVHQPPKEWKNGPCKINPLDIPAIRASGWSPDMDELARQPRHGPNYNQLLHLLNDLQNHQSAWPFLNPVNRDDVADYYDVIKEPMDLSTMEVKLEADNYLTPEDFIRDAKLIFDNCRKYNNETTPYAKSANKLEKFMWTQIKAIPEWSHLEPE